MEYARRISERLWNQADKGELEAKREQTFIDDIVQKAHIERELLASLEGVETALDAGGGCGRFSILLARQGVRVTHLDISQPMLDKAAQLAREAGVAERITFVKGALEELGEWKARSFDLVMSFDAPASYTYPHQEEVIAHLVRLARKKVLLSVSSRLGSVPYLANPLQKNQFILDPDCGDAWVAWCVNHREEAVRAFRFSGEACRRAMESGFLEDPQEGIDAYERGETPWCLTYHFLPDELTRILRSCGVRQIELAGPGAFARTIPNELLVRIMNDPAQREAFLDFCHAYDSNPYVCGMGKDNLFAKGIVE